MLFVGRCKPVLITEEEQKRVQLRTETSAFNLPGQVIADSMDSGLQRTQRTQ